jgi:hypothetical protein
VPGKDERSRPLRVTARGKKMLGDASTAWEKAQEQAVALVGDEGVALLRRMSKELVPAFPGD